MRTRPEYAEILTLVGGRVAQISLDTLNRGFRLGEWEVLPQRACIRSGDEDIRLEPGVMKVLLALAQRNGDLVSRDELVDEVWGRPTADGPIDRRIASLRKAFGDREEPRRYIETLPKLGYRLLKPVEFADPAKAGDDVLPPTTSATRPLRFRGILGVGGVIVAAVAAWLLWPQPRPAGFDSIAVLPFENLSSIAEDEALVFGFKEELVQTLHNIRGLIVKNVRASSGQRDAADIAKQIDVDTLLYGSLQRSGDTLKVSYTIETARDGATLEAGNVSGPADRLFELQELLAQQVQAELYPQLSQQLVSRSRPASAEAYNEFLMGIFAFDRRGQPGNIETAMARFRATIALDPDFGPAYLQLATAYALLPDYRGADLEESNSLALRTVDRGIEVDPNIEAAAGAVYGFVYHKQKRWEASRSAYERAVNAHFVDGNAFNWYSRMLGSVGDLVSGLEIAERGLELDPTSAVLNSRVAISYTWLGRNDDALRFFRRSQDVGAAGTTHLLAYALLLNRIGEISQSHAAARQGLEMAGLDGGWLDPFFAAIRQPAEAQFALEAVDAARDAGELTAQLEVVLRTLLGDIDGAMSVAERLEEPGEAFEMDLLYTPELRPLRRHAGFLPLMQRLGVQAYWRANRCAFRDGEVSCPEGS